MIDSWKRVPLAEIAEFTSKPRELRLTDYKAIPFVPMELIPSDKIAIDGFLIKDPSAISSGTFFRRGDILLPKITPSFENGKQAIAEDVPLPFGLATTEVIPLREKANISDKLFLFYLLLKGEIRRDLASRMEGTTGRQRLNTEALRTLPVLLPPLPEQRAIARVLRAVQEVMQALRRELELERERKAALMHHLFRYGTRGEPTKQTEIGEIPQSWEVVRLGDISEIVSGGTPDRAVPEYWNGEIPWVKTSEINYNIISDTEEKITALGLESSNAKIIPAETILMAMYGQGNTRGRVAILGINAAINQACAAIKLIEKSVLRDFIFHYLTHIYNRIRSLGYGANQKNLNISIIRDFLIPLPELHEQSIMADIFNAGNTKIAVLEQELALYQELFRALLEELMSGRLSVQPLLEQEPA